MVRATTVAALALSLSLTCGSALGFGMGGGPIGFAAGSANPMKYYPVCPHGRVNVSCQCRIGRSEDFNQLCSPGEYCEARSGSCLSAAPRRR